MDKLSGTHHITTCVILINMKLHRSIKYEVVIAIEILIVISKVISGVETESGLRIAPSCPFFK